MFCLEPAWPVPLPAPSFYRIRFFLRPFRYFNITVVECRKIASLTMSAVSSLKLRTPLHALEEERHFALVGWFCFANPRLAGNRFRSETQSDPCISSIRNRDHDYYFELLFLSEEQDAQSITRCSTEHHGDFRAVLRANRTCSTADNPIPGASSNTAESPVCAPLQPLPSCVHAASLNVHTCDAIPANFAP